MYPKFVLYDNKIILGKVQFHKYLLPDKYDRSLLFGGGWFSIDRDAKTITFNKESFDFGRFCEDRILEYEIEDRLKDYERIVQ